MAKAPAYQYYAQDFDMDTASWPNIAVGIYQRLLNYEWINKGIPPEISELASIAREKRIIFEKNWIKFIFKKFHENGNGFLVNDKMESIREEQAKYIESQKEKGKRGAEKRWNKQIAGAMPGPMPALQPDDSSSSSTSLKKEIYKERKMKLPDQEWIKTLKEKECYSHLNIDDELEKCITHFEAQNKTVSRARFLNWLNAPWKAKPLQRTENSPYKNLDYVKG